MFVPFLAQCGESMTDMSSVILSPGYPGNYPSGLDCTWSVILPIGFGMSSGFLVNALYMFCLRYVHIQTLQAKH